MADSAAYLPLLRMSIAMQDNPDFSQPPQAMEPDRAEWLKEAMANLLKNPVDELKVASKRLKDADPSNEEELTGALQCILALVENIDLARDFHKVGGFATVIEMIKPRNQGDKTEKDTQYSSQVRALCCETIGTVVHNHPETQAFANELNAIEPLCAILTAAGGKGDTTVVDDTLLNKCIYALLCLIRHNDVALQRFVREFKGISLLLFAMDNDDERVVVTARTHRRALSLLRYVMQRVPALVCALTAEHSFQAVSKVLLQHGEADVDCRESAITFFHQYKDTHGIPHEHLLVAVRALEHIKPIALREEDEASHEACTELLRVWKL